MKLATYEFPYLAGFFDGEGSTQIRRLKQKTRRAQFGFVVSASIASTDQFPILGIRNQFGGSICHTQPRNENSKSVYVWTIYGEKACNFLNSILPWLIIKRERAIMAIEFQSLMRKPKNAYPPLSEQELDLRNVRYFEMRKLNKRGIK